MEKGKTQTVAKAARFTFTWCFSAIASILLRVFEGAVNEVLLELLGPAFFTSELAVIIPQALGNVIAPMKILLNCPISVLR